MTTSASANAGFERPALVREGVYQHLRAAILDGEYVPGERLGEAELGLRLGVSRTPIREALMRLTQDGLIDTEANKGVRVRRPEVPEVRETYVVREELDGLAAALAAQTHTPADAQTLAAALQRLDESGADDREQTRLDLAFHRSLVDAAHNAVLSALHLDLEMRVSLIKHLTPGFNAHRQTHDQHAAIVQAVLRRDAASAREAARAHVRTFAALVLQQLAPTESPR